MSDGGAAVAGRVVSVNVGLPRQVTWRGRTVTTAIWKAPVDGRRAVRRLNVDGDGQADLVGHGGEHRAVYAYQVDSYRFWEQELGRDLGTASAGWGAFGENLTVYGLADSDVRIGDRFAVGTCLLEVTQPRVTCYKIGIRLDEPRMPALLTGRGRPGFYLRVLEEGEVGAGDEVTVVSRGRAALTVARVSAMLYQPDYDADLLRLAVHSPALSDGWKWSFRQQLDQVALGTARSGNTGLTGKASVAPAYPGFRPFRVVRTVDETTSGDSPVRSLMLAPADGAAPPPFRAGQFVTLRVPDGAGGNAVRSYSLSTASDGESLRVSVKRDGLVSGRLHTMVRNGDRIDVAAPRGGFVLDVDAPPTRPVVLCSAGVGVTPVLAMLHELADAPGGPSPRPVVWIHVARSGAEHAFRDEVRGLLARLPTARAHVGYTRPGPMDREGVDFHARGRLDAATMDRLVIDPDSDAYVCGPAGFMTSATALLVEAGVDPSRIRTEAFGAAARVTSGRAPHVPDGAPSAGPRITFARSGLTVRFGDGDAAPYGSLLELAEAADVPADWSCRTGVCHRCETALVAGHVAYDPQPLDAPGPGNTLLCVARPLEDVTVDL